MITIKPTTAGSLIMELPYASSAETKGAGLDKRQDGHTHAILQEEEFDEFLIKLLEARAKVKQLSKA